MTTGITAGTFDFCHAGHVLMLQECKKHCKRLIVALQTDPTIDRPEKNKPIQSTFERYLQLKACRYVDEVVPYDTEHDLENILASLDVDVRFLSEEYRGRIDTGESICRRRSIEIRFNKRFHDYSSTELRNRIHESRNNSG